MNGIPAETDNAPAAVPAEQAKQPKKPRVAAQAADVAPSKARSRHRATRAKKAPQSATEYEAKRHATATGWHPAAELWQ